MPIAIQIALVFLGVAVTAAPAVLIVRRLLSPPGGLDGFGATPDERSTVIPPTSDAPLPPSKSPTDS